MSDQGDYSDGAGSGQNTPRAKHKETDEPAERQQRDAPAKDSRDDRGSRPNQDAASEKRAGSHDSGLDDAMTLRRLNAKPSEAKQRFFARLNELHGDEQSATLNRIGNPSDRKGGPDASLGRYLPAHRDYGDNALGRVFAPASDAAHGPAGGHHEAKAGEHHEREAGESDQAGRPHAGQQPQGALDRPFALAVHAEKPAEADDTLPVKISAEYKSGVESPGEPEKSIEARLPVAEAKFNENVSVERRLGEHLSVQVAVDMSGQAEIGARVGAEGIGVYGKADASSGLQTKAQLDLGAAKAEGTAFFGARAEAEAQASFGPRGLSAKVHESAFAGASLGGEVKVGNPDLSLGLGGRLSEGIGEQVTVEGELGWTQTRLKVSADAAAGLGLGGTLDLRFSPRGLAHDVAHLARGAAHLAGDLIQALLSGFVQRRRYTRCPLLATRAMISRRRHGSA